MGQYLFKGSDFSITKTSFHELHDSHRNSVINQLNKDAVKIKSTVDYLQMFFDLPLDWSYIYANTPSLLSRVIYDNVQFYSLFELLHNRQAYPNIIILGSRDIGSGYYLTIGYYRPNKTYCCFIDGGNDKSDRHANYRLYSSETFVPEKQGTLTDIVKFANELAK